MRVGYHVAALVLAGSAAASAIEPRRAGDDLGPVRWLAGCWEMRRGARTTLEMWMPPAGGLMLGASRTVSGEQVVEYERVQLAAKDGKIVYTALPSGQAEASFTAVSVGAGGFTVENPTHDFPQRIIYRRVGTDSLVARIEGPGPNGMRGVDFPMRRASCEAQ